MNNIFENAQFGDKFRTRDGRKFVYLGKIKSLFSHECAYQGLVEDDDLMTYYNEEGKSLYCEYDNSVMSASAVEFGQVNSEEDSNDDIIGKWQEPINEKELDELADSEVYSKYTRDEPIYFEDLLIVFKRAFRIALGGIK